MLHNSIVTEPPLPVLTGSHLPATSVAPELRVRQIIRDVAFLVMSLAAVLIAIIAVDLLQIAVRLGIGSLWRNIYVQYGMYVLLATPIYLVVAQWQRQPVQTRLLRAGCDLAGIAILAGALNLFVGLPVSGAFYVLNMVSGLLGVSISLRTVPPVK